MKSWLLKSNELSLNSKRKSMSLSNIHDVHFSYSQEYLSLPKHREKTDKEILDLCRDKLGTDLQQRDLDRTHRLGAVKKE